MPFRELVEVVAQARRLDRPAHHHRVGFFHAESHILRQRSGEEKRVLRHVADIAPQHGQRYPAHVCAVHQHLPFLRLVHPGDQVDDACLARACRAHNRERAACRGMERYIVQHLLPVIAERNVVEANIAVDRLDWQRLIAVRDPGALAHELADAVHRGRALLVEADHPAQRDHRPGQHQQVAVELHELA